MQFGEDEMEKEKTLINHCQKLAKSGATPVEISSYLSRTTILNHDSILEVIRLTFKKN